METESTSHCLGRVEHRTVETVLLEAELCKPDADHLTNHKGKLTIHGRTFPCEFLSSIPIERFELKNASFRTAFKPAIATPQGTDLLKLEHAALPNQRLFLTIKRADIESIDHLTK